ncbi:hypothetical protein HDV00_011556 [Rhizophlyctis rosea]|nr:hypothetical protein HDV00_011556 [Rhizophlyctis rosea]
MLRRAIRESDLREVEHLIDEGVVVGYKQLYYDLSHIVHKRLDLTGWGVAVSALLTKYPDLGWCEDPRRWYTRWFRCDDLEALLMWLAEKDETGREADDSEAGDDLEWSEHGKLEGIKDGNWFRRDQD